MRKTLALTFLLLLSAPLVAQSAGCVFETIQTGGVDDAFTMPADAVHRSPALSNYLATRNPKDYDDTAIDHHFGDSLKLDACLICDQICSAKLEIELQGSGGLDCNDSLFAGQAGGFAVYSDYIYPGGDCSGPSGPSSDVYSQWKRSLTTSTSRTIDLDVKALQDLVCNLDYPYLDVIVQDDHAVDSLRLVIEH
jgi:hypothetical protein